MTFIPQALADPLSKSVIFVWRDEEEFNRYWADKVKTIDARGILTHPRFIRVDDAISLYVTGWDKTFVNAIDFLPDAADIPDYHRVGTYRFTCDCGYINVRVNGREVIGPGVFVIAWYPDEF